MQVTLSLCDSGSKKVAVKNKWNNHVQPFITQSWHRDKYLLLITIMIINIYLINIKHLLSFRASSMSGITKVIDKDLAFTELTF